MITVLIDFSPMRPSAVAAPLNSGSSSTAHQPPLPETHSSDNAKETPLATRTTTSVIYNDEPTRLNHNPCIFLQIFPEPGRPDIDALNYAALTVEEIAIELGTAIDWRAPGIQNLRPVVKWLCELEERKVVRTLIEVARRHRTGGRVPIQSWAYFEAEMRKLTTSQ
jgi:hypothetical protein